MRAALALAGLLLATRVLAAGEPAVVATTSKTEVSVGEPFTLEIRASGPAGATFVFPPELSDEAIEIATVPDSAQVSGGAASHVHRYRAAVFAVGDAQIPPIPVRYRLPDGSAGEVHTQAIPLRIVTLLPKAKDEQKLADVRAPVRLAVGRAFWIGLAALVLLVAGLVAWLLSRRRRAALVAAPSVPAIEPDDEARHALDALAGSGRLARGEYRPFYIDLTMIAKRYLERRLDAPIVEMTSAEMLHYLRANPHGMDMTPLLRDLSGAADRIKFARGSGITEEAERHLAQTRALVDGLEARLEPSDHASRGAPDNAAAAGDGSSAGAKVA